MTREEAIMILKNEQPHAGKRALFPEDKKYEAYNVAIEALSQQTGDAISREDALMCMTGEYLADQAYTPEDIISRHIKRIKALPSVTPKQISCKGCKYFINNATRTINFPNVCRWHDGFNPDEDWFCADFEEKTESEEQA